jgi:hypothetical protein
MFFLFSTPQSGYRDQPKTDKENTSSHAVLLFSGDDEEQRNVVTRKRIASPIKKRNEEISRKCIATKHNR